MHFAIQESSRVAFAVFPGERPVPVHKVVFPLALIDRTVLESHLSLSTDYSFFVLALVDGSIQEVLLAFTMLDIAFPVAFISRPIFMNKYPVPVCLLVLKVTFE